MTVFYPPDAPVPAGLQTEEFVLRPLGAWVAELDLAAVLASRELLHVRFGGDWPREGFTLEENREDLRGHEEEFAKRVAFTYTVLNPDETECLGCLYLYPLAGVLSHLGADDEAVTGIDERAAAAVFWTRPDRGAGTLDRRLLATLLPWLRGDFAFASLALPVRAEDSGQIALFRDAGLAETARYPAGESAVLVLG